MSLFGKRRSRGGEPHPWDASFPVLDLTGHGDDLTLGDLFTGIAVLGAAGSGKTSSLATVAYALMMMDCGFVWMCAKPDELRLVARIAERAGRIGDLVIIGEGLDGQITPNRFNPLAYEAGIPTTGAGSVAQYLGDCQKVLSHQEGSRTPVEEGPFFTKQLERLLHYCVDTAKFAGRPLSIDLLRLIQLSAPKSERELADNAWARTSECWRCLNEVAQRQASGLVAAEDLRRLTNFWTKDYLNLDPRPRGIIDVMFASLVDAFYAEEPLRSILTTTTTVVPEDVIERGKIVVLSLPTNVYHSAGRMAQYCFKRSFQRAMLRRRMDPSILQRPAVLWVDEAHAFAHPFDATYFSEVRSNRGISVFMDQGVGGYMRALGLNHVDDVDGFLQNLATKFFFQNNSSQTNQFAVEAIGKARLASHTSTFSASYDGAQFGGSTAHEERHRITTSEFGSLKRGGPKNRGRVEAYVLKPGAFRGSGTNVARCAFQQTDLTK